MRSGRLRSASDGSVLAYLGPVFDGQEHDHETVVASGIDWSEYTDRQRQPASIMDDIDADDDPED